MMLLGLWITTTEVRRHSRIAISTTSCAMPGCLCSFYSFSKPTLLSMFSEGTEVSRRGCVAMRAKSLKLDWANRTDSKLCISA
jgi:hypothetical protein